MFNPILYLDELSTLQLFTELKRRMDLLSQQKCHYCQRQLDVCSCRFSEHMSKEYNEFIVCRKLDCIL